MSSGLGLWFHRSRYRALIDRSLWHEALRSLKRVHKDSRARKHLLLVGAALAVLMLVLTGCIVYLAFVIGTGAWFFVPVIIPVSWWIRRSAKQEFAPMNIAPPPTPPKAQTEAIDSGRLVSYLSHLAVLHAVFVDRAGSEGYLKQKQIPIGAEVITRRLHLDLLKKHELWENISATDREAIMLPDGAWDWDRINKASGGFEVLRTLRWILRVDFALATIALYISTDFATSHEVVINPSPILDAVDLIDVGAVRSAREQAHIVLLRCLAESISRGYLMTENAEMRAWAEDVSTSLRGSQSEDLLIGDRLVSEATEAQLSWALSVARVRHELLVDVEAFMEGKQPLPLYLEGRVWMPGSTPLNRSEVQIGAQNS